MDPQQLMSRFKALASSLSPVQLASLVAAFLLVVGIVGGGAWWVSAPTYTLLYSGMDAEGAASMVRRLKALKVSYTLDEGGSSIRVPRERVDELKLELAAEGLPESGRVGWEIFDRTGFGTTEFQEQVSLRRALEGEIARTIGTLSAVSSARVHISMGKAVLFGEAIPPKASVALKLRGRVELPKAAVIGITNLVAASVDGLAPEAVMIIDSVGNPLTRPAIDDRAPAGAAQMERQQALERDMNARVVALLEPVIGLDRVRVSVALRLNPTTVEETEERFDPSEIVRSRQTTADTTSTMNPGGGIAGVRSNTPPPAPDPKNPAPVTPAAPLTASGGSGTSRSAETVNYEINRKLVVTQRPPGEIARLSLAVIVDDEQLVRKASDGGTTTTRTPRTPEELQQLEAIVAAGIGLEPERGDMITVRNISFEEALIEEAPPLTTLQQVSQYRTELWDGARLLAVVVLGTLAMLFFVRPLMQRAGGGRRTAQQVVALAGPGQPLRTVADLESEIEAQLDASAQQSADTRRLPVLARRVSTMSAKEPENVAKLLRSWINEGER